MTGLRHIRDVVQDAYETIAFVNAVTELFEPFGRIKEDHDTRMTDTNIERVRHAVRRVNGGAAAAQAAR